MGGTEEGYAADGTEIVWTVLHRLESQHRMPVVVIGEDVPEILFPNMDPSGKSIDVNGSKSRCSA